MFFHLIIKNITYVRLYCYKTYITQFILLILFLNRTKKILKITPMIFGITLYEYNIKITCRDGKPYRKKEIYDLSQRHHWFPRRPSRKGPSVTTLPPPLNSSLV